MSLILELPNSLVNQVWKTKDEEIINDLLQELGMFMTCLRVVDDKQIQITRSCKSSLAEFRLSTIGSCHVVSSWLVTLRSPLLRTIETLVLSPLLVLGLITERQRLDILLMEDFTQTSESSANSFIIEILSRHIQIYSAR